MASHVWELSNWNGNYSKKFSMIKEIAINEYSIEKDKAESIALFFIERLRQKGKEIDIREYYNPKTDRFDFPEEEKMCEKWLENIKKEIPFVKPNIISKHNELVIKCKEKGLIQE